MSVYRVGTNKSSTNVFPSVRPTLDLDFANSKTLDPRITFTRSSGGSYVGADGLIKYAGVNEARFDHDPETGESLGLLIEEGRTNLATFSENWGNFHVKENVDIVVNDAISPDGTLTADKLICTVQGGVNSGIIQKIASISASTSWHTCSWFIKNNGARESNLQIAHSGGTYIAFTVKINWTSGDIPTFVQSSTNGTANRIIHPVQKFPNGWFRFSISQQNNGTGTSLTNRIYVSSDTSTVNGDSIYSWGSQMEAAEFPLSYIPTLGSARTRANDITTITGRNFSDFYNPNEFSIYNDFVIKGNWVTTGFNRVIQFRDITGTNTINTPLKLGTNSTNLYDEIVKNNIQQLEFNTIPYNYYDRCKYAIGIKQNDIFRYAAVNNNIKDISVDSVVDLTNLNLSILDIGYDSRNGFYQLNGTLRRLTYWPKRLPNEQLIALTR